MALQSTRKKIFHIKFRDISVGKDSYTCDTGINVTEEKLWESILADNALDHFRNQIFISISVHTYSELSQSCSFNVTDPEEKAQSIDLLLLQRKTQQY